MPKIDCEVINQKGLHARAAAKVVAEVIKYNCSVELRNGDKSAPGNSLIKLLTLNAPKGTVINISGNGEQAAHALSALEQLFATGFGE